MRNASSELLSVILLVSCSTHQSGSQDSGVPSGRGGSSGQPASQQAGAGSSAGGSGGATLSGGSGAASQSGGSGNATQPAGWDDAFRVARAVDESDDPKVFETHLVAELKELEILPGLMTELYAYNGTVPGPEIRVKRGDRVVVHFTNELPEDTSIHWHGLRVPNDMDGVPGITQAPILPGETFTYDFVVPDAGTFWYHPHIRSAAQVGFGMYGSFVVDDPDEPEDLGDEQTLVLSDISLDEHGKLLPADDGSRVDSVFGREGNVLLINGKVEPILRARSGRRQRWRLINAARTRYFEIAMEGESFLRFAGDAGMSDRSVEKTHLVIIPGERMEVIFDPIAAPNTTIDARWIPTDRGFGSTVGRQELPLFSIELDNEEAYEDAELPELGRSIPPIDVTNASTVPLEMTLGLDPDGYTILGINGVPFWDATPLDATIGETQIWQLTDATGFAHPFHLHGYFFQVLSIEGNEPEAQEWKDTVNIHANGETRIAVRFDDRPGTWMTHCHILDHAELGMMTTLEVTEPGAGGAAGSTAN